MRIIRDQIRGKIGKNLKGLDKVAEKAYDEFVKVTPIRSGNAKRSTDFEKSSNEIQGNYNYANRLNKGWSSQAPEGMTDPTIDFVRNEVRRIIR